MIREALKMLGAATARLRRDWRAASLLLALYALLLGTLYLFISTSEATRLQVALTLLSAALAPALFFILQAVTLRYAQGERRAAVLLGRSLRDSCKLALVSLPLILLAVVFFYLLNKLQLRSQIFLKLITPAWPLLPDRWTAGSGQTRQWAQVMMATLRFLAFAMFLPLLAIQLWGATLRDGLRPTLRRAHRTLLLAFTPKSVLTYALGLTLFAIVPYFLLLGHAHAGRAWLEMALLVARLLLIFLLTLYGWTITLSALNKKG